MIRGSGTWASRADLGVRPTKQDHHLPTRTGVFPESDQPDFVARGILHVPADRSLTLAARCPAPACRYGRGNHGCQFRAASHHVDHTIPAASAPTRSMWPSRGLSADIGLPDSNFVAGLMGNHGCQLGAASHQVDHTVPSVPDANRSMWPSLGESAVTAEARCR